MDRISYDTFQLVWYGHWFNEYSEHGYSSDEIEEFCGEAYDHYVETGVLYW